MLWLESIEALVKKLFWKYLENSQKIHRKMLFVESCFYLNTMSLWVTWKRMWHCPIFTEWGLHHRCFPWNFPKIFRTTSLKNTSKQLPPLFNVVYDVPFYLSTLKLILWCINKVQGSTKANYRIFLQVKFDFWGENHIFFLFQLSKQLKIHSSFMKINPAKSLLLEVRHMHLLLGCSLYETASTYSALKT